MVTVSSATLTIQWISFAASFLVAYMAVLNLNKYIHPLHFTKFMAKYALHCLLSDQMDYLLSVFVD